MLGAAAALLVAPKPALPAFDLLAAPLILPTLPILRAGDRLDLKFNGLPAEPTAWTVELTSAFDSNRGTITQTTVYSGSDVGAFFVAPRDYIVTDARVVVGGYVHRVPIEIQRSGK